MKKRAKEKVKKSRKRVAVEWGIQILLALVLVAGIGVFQTRNMVAADMEAPPFSLTDISGKTVDLGAVRGKKTVLYFFAPWCSVCHASSHNINSLRDAYTDDEMAIFAVGLGWDSPQEVQAFARKHKLRIPVLVGTEETARAYRVSAFPSIYILDAEHRVAHRMVGYATEIGLRARALFTGWF